MIDENKLIKEIRTYADEKALNSGYIEYCNGILASIGVVKSQPQVNQWVPVSERLPQIINPLKHTQWVMVTTYSGDVLSLLYNFNTAHFYRDRLSYDVIAWQPLPESYKEKV